MPLVLVERLAMKGPVDDSQVFMVHLELADHHHYQVMGRVSQSSPPSYSLLLERRSLPATLRPSLDQSLLVIVEPLDIGGSLEVYSGGEVIALPGIVAGFEISV
jgi:hypothetical protein